MKMGWMTETLCFLFLSVPALLGPAASGQSETPSVLDRVQQVDDPELGELIRVTRENRKLGGTMEDLEVLRKVTQSYAQIKLLDQQIGQVARKLDAQPGPAELRYELLLAKAELESRLMVELATLREVMGVIPKHAFEKHTTDTLNTWLAFSMIDDRVYVLDNQKPFLDYWAEWRLKSAGLLPQRETLNYVRERLANKAALPVRIDIYYVPEMKAKAEDLYNQILSLARETNAQMGTEVRLEQSTWIGSGESPFFLRDGTIRTFYPSPVRPPNRGARLLTGGVINPNDLEQHILWRLTFPKNVPLTFRIEYDEASALVANQVAEMVKAVAGRLGVADVVQVKEVLVQPVPESAFVGRWGSLGKGIIGTIEIQPGGVCRVTMDQGTSGIGAQTNVEGTWTSTMKEIIVDIKDRVPGRAPFYYHGSLDAKGDLVIHRMEV
ncbi:MAG: hypothetical protein ACM3VT_00260, partial [Solirubrobacterales bacterium]